MAKLLHFERQVNVKRCDICRIPFSPAQDYHVLCITCYLGARWVEAFRRQDRMWRELTVRGRR